jgi:microcystin-dependent protein
MTLYKWSQTATADANADSTINWSEGQSPSSVNDSARAMMAATAKYRDDIAGAIVTGGTSTAYTVSSYEVFDTLARLNGQMIAFTPHATNAATVTLNVDGLGAKPLRSAPSAELPAGTLVAGTPYVALYNNSDAAWYLRGFHGNPYNIPLAGGMPFFAATAPNSSFVFPYGQAISRTTYAALFALIGMTYGAGDGSTTFHLPDLRGRVPAGKDDMGGAVSVPPRLTTAGGGVDGVMLGAVGGSQSQTLALAQLPTGITSTGTSAVTNLAGKSVPAYLSGSPVNVVAGGAIAVAYDTGGTPNISILNALTGTASVTSSNTSGSAHPNVQPTIICNYIMRII